MLVNGATRSTLSILDRGLNYGDGLFETIAVVDGQPCLWARHMARLRRGCEALALPAPDTGRLLDESMTLIAGRERCVLKIILTRGEGGRGYAPPETAEPRRVLYTADWPPYTAEQRRRGVRLRVCTTRLGGQPALAGLKHLNRLEQVLARSEWRDPSILDGIMLDGAGDLVECTASNLFLLGEAGLETPPLTDCGVAGVMRELVLEIAAGMGLEVRERRVPLAGLARCRALFITNSLAGVLPVRRVDDEQFDLGLFERELGPLVHRVLEQAFEPGEPEGDGACD